MKLGIFAKTFAGDRPDQVLRAAATAGFAAVQYNMACSGIGSLPATVPEAFAADVKAASVATGVGIAAISATYNMIHPDMARRLAGRTSFAAIAASVGHVRDVLDGVERFVWSFPEVEVISIGRTWMDADE